MNMEGETNQQQPTPCRTGCGFYGNQASDGLCSKCYKDTIKQNQDASQPAIGPSASATTTTSTTQTPDCKGLSSPERPSASATVPVVPETETQKELDQATSPIAEASETDATSTLDTSMSSPDKGKKKNRCNVCRKKVGLTGFVCRCSGLFCGLHRYSDKHECTYDYKADAREQIAKQNPVIVGEKVKKI